MADLQQEHHREIEGLLENIRQLSRELRLQMLIIDNFIPQEYQVSVSVCVLLPSAAVQPPTHHSDSHFLSLIRLWAPKNVCGQAHE